MFELQFQDAFRKRFHKYIKNDKILLKSLNKTLKLMMENPFYSSLNTHKVDTKRNRDIWSSRITGDWRIGWVFDEESKKAVIICLELGTHSGSNQVYKNKS
jgi:mRNA-degrading endonuclease YafQ of YafQ-DinJ toxin-antitoxin module